MKIFADGADIRSMREALRTYEVDGFTTNPTLMSQAGIPDYLEFATKAASEFCSTPISFEVFSDIFGEMYEQALKLNSLGDNVYVKIPITNTRGETSSGLIRHLSNLGIKVNVTAIFTTEQATTAYNAINHSTPSVISVFAGRIADTLLDPEPIMREVSTICDSDNCELLWASAREMFNILQADRSGCDIITLPHGVLSKFNLKGKNLKEYSLETVDTFYQDAKSSGFKL